jgi:BirA family biotin operon repressor/biotin-[acetyl-CoA-carboxylase] ligase
MGQDVDRLRACEIEKHLRTEWLGRVLRCHDEVDSTNDLARDLGRAGAPNGTVVTAEAQRKGRGRLGRSWSSPPFKNLYLSALLHPLRRGGVPSPVSLMAGVAVCDTVNEWHPATIKWPNDILVDGRKLAGILTEMDGDAREPFFVVGIGVNLNSLPDDFPEELRSKAVSLREATRAIVDRGRFAATLLNHLECRWLALQENGFPEIATAWCGYSTMIGRWVRVQEPGGEVAGTATGLDADGALRLRLPSGVEHRVVAGDVTVVDGYEGGRRKAGG